jgi:CheY-like chemotaxis protein
MSNEKILIVDDQRGHLRLMKEMVESCGKCAVTVDSAEEAELILEWYSDIHALITDLKMPWLDGVDFCKNTKRKYPAIKVYALSGNLQAYDRHVLDDAGFDGIYQKPVRFEIIKAILGSI